MPSCMEFQQSPFGCEALLTVAWRELRVQHIPMVFSVGEGGGMVGVEGERQVEELFTEY